MKAFGQAGAGIFISPMAIATENMEQYGVELIGSTDDVASIFTPFRPNEKYPISR
jgi:LysR family transcriptional activator of nhaA